MSGGTFDHNKTMNNSLFHELNTRGLTHNSTENIEQLLAKPTTFYIGFDPTSDSLHVGSLLGIITAIRFINHGHKALFLIGGATGLIGDPSGKSQERNLLEPELVQQNAVAIQNQIETLLTNANVNQDSFEFVNNSDWMREINFVSFLRDVGKHVRVNNLLNKDSVKRRLESDEGISFTEFTYSLIQAFDFTHLAKIKDCILQLGGSDQWGNIVSGIDLGKKMHGADLHGLTFPLLTKQDGTKFGKTEKGTIFLSKHKTSPFAFFQFWLNVTDEESIKLAPMLLQSPILEVQRLIEESKLSPQKRILQQTLAKELTALVHGKDEALKAEHNSVAIFQAKEKQQLETVDFESILSDIPHALVKASLGMPVIELLMKTALFKSKTDARNLVKNKGVMLNNVVLIDEKLVLQNDLLVKNQYILVKKGKRDIFILVFEKGV